MKRLVIIDGNALLHRAYHALPPLTDPDGTIVNAVYGFASVIIKLYSELKPTHMAVAFDRPVPTFRKILYKDYQAKRPEMEDALSSQIPKVQELVKAFGIPRYEADGFEADDVIGTVTKMAGDEKIDQVVIVTGDRDLLQLVKDDRVYVYMPTKGISENKIYGEKEVQDKMGVTPAQIPDLKALAGDSSDNYPGVAGIGPKTAAQLLGKYGSLERIYRKIDEVRSDMADPVAEKLKAGRETALLFHNLATIRTDVPVDVDLKKTEIKELDTDEAREFLLKLHFPSLLKRLASKSGETEKTEKPVKKKKKVHADN